METFFFRVEHGLLRSAAFKTLGGSAIKVYLTIGSYADFESGWAYPSIRTLAKQAGLSRQTVLAAIGELANTGLVATSKAKGKSTAYKIMHQAPPRPAGGKGKPLKGTVPDSLGDWAGPGVKTSGVDGRSVPDSGEELANFFGPAGPGDGPKREAGTREEAPSAPIPGTPFRLSVEGRLIVAAEIRDLLTEQGLSPRLAERLAGQKSAEVVAKVLLNALYLRSQGRLQNGVGYIRAGIEDGYELLPPVAARLESRRRELEAEVRKSEERHQRVRQQASRAAEEAAIGVLIEGLTAGELDELVGRAVTLLPGPLVRRNPSLSNPFVRAKVYELAGGDPAGE